MFHGVTVIMILELSEGKAQNINERKEIRLQRLNFVNK